MEEYFIHEGENTMTDLALSEENDLVVINGQLQLLQTQEAVTRQRLLISLRTFTKTWFENQNFGINQELVFAKGTKDLLDQDIKTIIAETDGVVKLVSYTSHTDPETRVHYPVFVYETLEGNLTSITGEDIIVRDSTDEASGVFL